LVYRKLNIPILDLTAPITGHVFLAFDDNGMADAWSKAKSDAGLSDQTPITMSFHPYSVKAARIGDKNNKNQLLWTFITNGSFVDLDERAHDINSFEGGGDKLLITSSECSQITLFKTAIASMNLNNGGTPDPGPYGFLQDNCAYWATTIVRRAKLQVPGGAFWNLGVGMGSNPGSAVGGILTAVGQTTDDIAQFLSTHPASGPRQNPPNPQGRQ
jgi:hypothetical protein